MKVKDAVLMLSCIDGDLDLRIQDREGVPTILCETSEDKQPVLIIRPVSGAYEAGGMIGMYIGMAFSAQYQEEQAIEIDDETSDDEEEVEQTIDEIRNEMAKIDRRSFKQFGKVHTYNKEYCSMHAPLMESTASIIANKCAMGGGKTNAAATRVIKLKAQTKAAGQKDWRTVVVSFRISLTGTYTLKCKGFTA